QETLEWLHFLLRFDTTARLMLVGAARDDELASTHPLRTLLLDLRHSTTFTEIALPPLDAAETSKLAAVLADAELTVNTAMRLYRETEGNPLFVVETMRAELDDPRAGREQADHGSDEAPSQSPPPLPPMVRAVIAARLAQVSPAARELASLAATIGREFRLDVLASASKSEEDDIVRALDELWRLRIVRDQGANAYDFTHDKLREVAYDETSGAQRRLLHRRIARALEDVYADDLDPVSGRIASHYDRAGFAEQSLPYYQRAAEVARRVYANGDAIAFLVRALALLGQLPAGAARDSQELRVLLMLAPIYRITRGWTAPELEQVILRSLALCDELDAGSERAEALSGWESVLVVQAKLEKVLLVAEDLRALSERSRRIAPPLSDMMVAGARMHLGHLAEANEMFERMIGPHNPNQSTDDDDALGWNYAVHARAWHAHVLWCLGYPDRAHSRGLEAVQLAPVLALPFNQALASTYLAMLQ
ncbi:MAG: ATP-binding protein, partial [Ktedonobacterales bacterium]